MTGDICRAHIATTIEMVVGENSVPQGREPVLCNRWVPGFALVCNECGADSPRVRLERFVRNPPDIGIELMSMIRNSYQRRSGRPSHMLRGFVHTCKRCGGKGHYTAKCKVELAP